MGSTFRSKAMSREEATKWLRRFYYALSHHKDLTLKFQKDMTDPRGLVQRERWGIPGVIAGLYDPNESTITINPSRRVYGGYVKIIIHEMIHHVAYDLGEKQVVDLENLIYEALSDRQLWNLMQKVCSRRTK